MLRALTDDHVGVSRYYYFDIGVAETLRRHETKQLVAVSPEMLRNWFRPRDLLGFVDESIITGDESEEQIVSRLVSEVGFCDPPVRAGWSPWSILSRHRVVRRRLPARSRGRETLDRQCRNTLAILAWGAARYSRSVSLTSSYECLRATAVDRQQARLVCTPTLPELRHLQVQTCGCPVATLI
jgi:hypothetical protein